MRNHVVTWDDVLERARNDRDRYLWARVNTEVLQTLRPRWENSIEVDYFWIHGIAFWPRGAPRKTCVRALAEDRGAQGQVVVVALVEFVPRSGLEQAGGLREVAGDVCSPANAVTVVDAMLLQLAEPADALLDGF
jgi:hypothetical protein